MTVRLLRFRGDIIVQVLADEGVDTVFGHSGGAIFPLMSGVR
jgi:thiamine pyrophosphate-dependent acetolactate synthase large subunit-like protein